MNISERIKRIIFEKNSYLCVGIDPDITDSRLANKGYVHGESSLKKCLELIEVTSPHASFFKFNFAFALTAFENPIKDLAHLVGKSKEFNAIAILDFKAGDIANTSRHYAKFAFEVIEADAVTLNPYMGCDVIKPFLEYKDKMSFVLTKTSNKPEMGIQDLVVGDHYLYEKSIKIAYELNKVNNNVGVVVGATDTEAIDSVRSDSPDQWVLIPGVGFQGGQLNKVIESAKSNFIINVSRQIMHSDSPEIEALSLKKEINNFLF